MWALLLTPLCLVGFLISSYFTAVAFRWIEPDSRWIPSFCRLGKDTCASIVFTPRARLFGLPNSVLGQIFYLAVLLGFWGRFLFASPFYYAYLLASLVTVAVGLYLSYSLLFLTRVPCKLCFTSHALNLFLFLILVLGVPD